MIFLRFIKTSGESKIIFLTERWQNYRITFLALSLIESNLSLIIAKNKLRRPYWKIVHFWKFHGQL